MSSFLGGAVSKGSLEELREHVLRRVESMRPKLLDLTRRNALINTRLSGRGSNYIRVVDEVPDILFYELSVGKTYNLGTLPPLDQDPKDERNNMYQRALSEARAIDQEFAAALEAIDAADEQATELQRKAERALRDRVRETLGMAPRQTKKELSLIQHAKNNHIEPAYDLPSKDGMANDGRHEDDVIQTLLLPDMLERLGSRLVEKARSWEQETGLRVMQAAFGYLEWKDPKSDDLSYSPLVILPVELERKRTPQGMSFKVTGRDDGFEMNRVIVEKLRQDFAVELPEYDGGSIEEYLKKVEKTKPRTVPHWRVRRYVVLGTFPSSRLAMFHDLDTERSHFKLNSVVNAILAGQESRGDATPFAPDYLVDKPEIENKVPLLVSEADSSQFSTIADVSDGTNLAVEGPPGTGKSQTIVNTIAVMLAQGKKVLFVAEKMAALDVVRSRLNSCGLGEFILSLQATQSSRAQVVASIKDRLEMRAGHHPSDFDVEGAQFRKAREEIQSYVDIMSSEFKNTGLTVYEVISKSIATSQFLNGAPKSLQTPYVPGIEEITPVDIRERIEAASELGQALADKELISEFWAGLKRDLSTRFQMDGILQACGDTASEFERLEEINNELIGFGISERLTDREIKAVSEAAERLYETDATYQLMLKKLLEQRDPFETLEVLNKFIAACEEFERTEKELSNAATGPFDQALLETLRKAQATVDQHRLETIRITDIQKEISDFEGRISALDEHISRLERFFKEVPLLEDFSVRELFDAKVMVDQADREALEMREAASRMPSFPNTIWQIAKQAKELKRSKTLLEETYRVDDIPSSSELGAALHEIENAGAFAFLNASYRNAIRIGRRFSKGKKLDRSGVQSALSLLKNWKASVEMFNEETAYLKFVDPRYLGYTTDFSKLHALSDYFLMIDKVYEGIEYRPIREFLRSADVDLIRSIPSIDTENPETSLADLRTEREAMVARKSELEAAHAELVPSAQRLIGSPASKSLFGELAINVETLLNSKSQIEADQQVCDFLDKHFAGTKTHEKIEMARLDGLARHFFGLNEPERKALVGEQSEGRLCPLKEALHAAIERREVSDGALYHLKEALPGANLVSDANPSEVASELRCRENDREGLAAASRLYRARLRFQEQNGLSLLSAIDDWAVSSHNIVNVIEAAIMRALSIEVFRQHQKILSKYDGATLERARRRLVTADQKLTQLSRKKLRVDVYKNAAPPSGIGQGKVSSYTQLSLLEHETSKQRRFVPVRDLVKRAGKSLQEIKPCWMMSPLALAQYVPLGYLEFDLCIIDEASQMPPENAIGALIRAKQTMIVGDTNQLPPTSFFRKMISDEDADEDEQVTNESILEMANAAFRPPRRLRWHYRSRTSALIRFSNRMVYDDDLIVFPAAQEEHPKMGVRLVTVDGLYKSGANPREAEEMVKAILKFMKEEPERSLGVVLLNQKQQELIQDELNYAVMKDSNAAKFIEKWETEREGLEPFFVKNLENVQGDERDVIFIGTVYGAETEGSKVHQRFGPIGGIAGKRRLNVLFSRAKEQIVTFSSMRSADITAVADGNPGHYMLKTWLEYSATGRLDAGTVTSREPDSDFEIFVADQIRAMGCEPIYQVGVAGYFVDIGVRHPSFPHGFLLGVECDGANYHSAKSARDRDRLRQEILENLGWSLHRIWSTDWFNDPVAQAAKLRKRIEERLEEVRYSELRSDVSQEGRERGETIAKSRQELDADSLLDLFTPKAERIVEDKGENEVGRTEPNPNSRASKKNARSLGAQAGDRVRVQYLEGDKATLLITLSDVENKPDKGIIHISQPLGEALLGAEEGDEIDVLIGSRVRKAQILAVEGTV